ncbi:MAG: hypothetical protein ACK557_24595 [Planctomycetota bacterium]
MNRKRQENRASSTRLRKFGLGRVETSGGDLTDEDQCSSLVFQAEAQAKISRIGLLAGDPTQWGRSREAWSGNLAQPVEGVSRS